MEKIQIISEWKKRPKSNEGKNTRIKAGHKRVMAIIKDEQGRSFTRHIDVKK